MRKMNWANSIPLKLKEKIKSQLKELYPYNFEQEFKAIIDIEKKNNLSNLANSKKDKTPVKINEHSYNKIKYLKALTQRNIDKRAPNIIPSMKILEINKGMNYGKGLIQNLQEIKNHLNQDESKLINSNRYRYINEELDQNANANANANMEFDVDYININKKNEILNLLKPKKTISYQYFGVPDGEMGILSKRREIPNKIIKPMHPADIVREAPKLNIMPKRKISEIKKEIKEIKEVNIKYEILQKALNTNKSSCIIRPKIKSHKPKRIKQKTNLENDKGINFMLENRGNKLSNDKNEINAKNENLNLQILQGKI